MEDGQVAADDDAAAAEFAQDVGHHFVVPGQLVVQPDILDRQAQLLEQMEDQLQLRIDQRLAGDAAVKHRHAQDGFAVQNRHGDLRAEQLEFLLRLDVVAGLLHWNAAGCGPGGRGGRRCRLQTTIRNAASRPGDKPDGAGGAQPPAFLQAGASPKRAERLPQENGGAVDAEDFAQQQQELLEHAFGVERMGEDG